MADVAQLSQDQQAYIVQKLGPILDPLVRDCLHALPEDPALFVQEWCSKPSGTEKVGEIAPSAAEKTSEPSVAKSTNSSKPVLHYFGFAGRGEITRLIAAAGGLELDACDLPEDRKEICASCGALGTGVPVMTHGDLRLCQSQAIQNYVALSCPMFSNVPAQARAIDMMWCANFEDSLADIGPSGIFGVLFGGDATDFKAEDLKEALVKWFSLYERLSPTEGFINKLKFPTAADCVAVMLYNAEFPWSHFYKHATFDVRAYPKFEALADRAAAAPGLVEYLSTSTTLRANPFAK